MAKKKKKPVRRRRARPEELVDSAPPDAPTPHNFHENRPKDATVVFEASATGRPSRKSTRRSAGRKKGASVLERRRQHEANRPEAKAMRKKKPGSRRKTNTRTKAS